jgi:hypothetical protein
MEVAAGPRGACMPRSGSIFQDHIYVCDEKQNNLLFSGLSPRLLAPLYAMFPAVSSDVCRIMQIIFTLRRRFHVVVARLFLRHSRTSRCILRPNFISTGPARGYFVFPMVVAPTLTALGRHVKALRDCVLHFVVTLFRPLPVTVVPRLPEDAPLTELQGGGGRRLFDSASQWGAHVLQHTVHAARRPFARGRASAALDTGGAFTGNGVPDAGSNATAGGNSRVDIQRRKWFAERGIPWLHDSRTPAVVSARASYAPPIVASHVDESTIVQIDAVVNAT